MAYSNWTIGWQEINRLGKQLQGLEDSLDEAITNALDETGKYVTRETQKAISSSPHNFHRTGETLKLLDDNPKTTLHHWRGRTVGSINTGFKLRSDSGDLISLAPIYLMYGTNPKNGKGVRPDSNLKNAVKGEGLHRAKIQKIQQDEFNKVISKVMEKK